MAFFGSKLSEHMSRTSPEGFLVCHEVPIARTGWLEYTPQELGLDDPRPVVRVYRSPDDLFSPGTIASFEGKSVTDQHPPENVSAENYHAYERGHVQNVRRGTALPSGDIPLIANLLIKDPGLASQVEPSDGVRHVSIGYTHKIVPYGKDYQAINLQGNHVAVVPRGRAGHEIAIRDAAPAEIQVLEKQINLPPGSRSNNKMAIDTKSLFGRMLKAFALDAAPEEVAEAAKMGAKDATSEELAHETINPLDSRMASLEAAVTALVADKKARDEAAEKKPDEEAMDEDMIESEAADSMEEPQVIDPEDRPENPIPGGDTVSTIESLRKLKPFVARSGDKAMIDHFNTALRAAKGKPQGSKTGQDAYKALSAAIAVKSADAEAALADTKLAEMTAYKAMLDAAGEKAAAGYRR